MGHQVIWTGFAKRQLELVYKYYSEHANESIATRIAQSIFTKTLVLSNNPRIGQKEVFLENRIREFRYLVYKNYKIIYWVDDDKSEVVVADVFDTRQNPDKIRRNK
jgi:plasmid stabilization system protein ParE